MHYNESFNIVCIELELFGLHVCNFTCFLSLLWLFSFIVFIHCIFFCPCFYCDLWSTWVANGYKMCYINKICPCLSNDKWVCSVCIFSYHNTSSKYLNTSYFQVYHSIARVGNLKAIGCNLINYRGPYKLSLGEMLWLFLFLLMWCKIPCHTAQTAQFLQCVLLLLDVFQYMPLWT